MGNSATIIPNPSCAGRRRELRCFTRETRGFVLLPAGEATIPVSDPARQVRLETKKVRFMVKKEARNEPDEGLQASQSSLFHMMLEVFEFRQTPSAGFCCNVVRNSNIK
jgi:hypothetical protein